jgi:hypothetical protein
MCIIICISQASLQNSAVDSAAAEAPGEVPSSPCSLGSDTTLPRDPACAPLCSPTSPAVSPVPTVVSAAFRRATRSPTPMSTPTLTPATSPAMDSPVAVPAAADTGPWCDAAVATPVFGLAEVDANGQPTMFALAQARAAATGLQFTHPPTFGAGIEQVNLSPSAGPPSLSSQGEEDEGDSESDSPPTGGAASSAAPAVGEIVQLPIQADGSRWIRVISNDEFELKLSLCVFMVYTHACCLYMVCLLIMFGCLDCLTPRSRPNPTWSDPPTAVAPPRRKPRPSGATASCSGTSG